MEKTKNENLNKFLSEDKNRIKTFFGKNEENNLEIKKQ